MLDVLDNYEVPSQLKEECAFTCTTSSHHVFPYNTPIVLRWNKNPRSNLLVYNIVRFDKKGVKSENNYSPFWPRAPLLSLYNA